MIKININIQKIIVNRIIDIVAKADISKVNEYIEGILYDDAMYDDYNDLINDIVSEYITLYNKRGY